MTRLYLDVDGVLNAWQAFRVWGDVERGRATSFNGTWDIIWAPNMVTELNKLDVELVWATTWRDDSIYIAKLLGLTLPSRVIHPLNGVTSFPSILWKWEAIKAEQEADPSPFIWCDDELQAWHDIESNNKLILSINSYTGITPDDIEQMKSFVASHADLGVSDLTVDNGASSV